MKPDSDHLPRAVPSEPPTVPLPEPYKVLEQPPQFYKDTRTYTSVFTADQMRAYALTAIQSALARQAGEVEAVCRQVIAMLDDGLHTAPRNFLADYLDAARKGTP